MSRDPPNYRIVEIDQNTEKSPGDLRRLVVTQTPVEKPSANAGVKNSKMSKIIIIIIIIMTLQQKSYQRDKRLGCPSCYIQCNLDIRDPDIRETRI